MILREFRLVLLTISILILADVIIWFFIFSSWGNDEELNFYFLDVGQGDSELIVLPQNVKVLIDGGKPNSRVLKELDQVLSINDNYIDLVVLTHPDLDHFGGLIDVFKKYEIGVFISTGRKTGAENYNDLIKIIKDNGVRYIALAEGDKINHENNEFLVLSPNLDSLLSNALNDSSLVLMFQNSNINALYTGDIGIDVENYLVRNYDLKAEILKVAHHGSRFSSTDAFLEEVNPKVSIIGVGKNSYGHPTKQVLDRIKDLGSKVFRTDRNGTVKISVLEDKISVYTEK